MRMDITDTALTGTDGHLDLACAPLPSNEAAAAQEDAVESTPNATNETQESAVDPHRTTDEVTSWQQHEPIAAPAPKTGVEYTEEVAAAPPMEVQGVAEPPPTESAAVVEQQTVVQQDHAMVVQQDQAMVQQQDQAMVQQQDHAMVAQQDHAMVVQQDHAMVVQQQDHAMLQQQDHAMVAQEEHAAHTNQASGVPLAPQEGATTNTTMYSEQCIGTTPRTTVECGAASTSDYVTTMTTHETATHHPEHIVSNNSGSRAALHPLLTDENTRDIVLRFHQQRSFLKRVVEQCALDRVYLPENLIEAIRCILNDEVPPPMIASSSTASGNNSSSHHRTTATDYASTLQQSVDVTSQMRQKQDLSSMLRDRCSSKQSLRNEDETKSVVLPISAHIDLSQHSILHHPKHAASIIRDQEAREEEKRQFDSGKVPPPRVTHADLTSPKQLLEDAFLARRSGNRRREIEILVDYVMRGREGRILLDTATTMRLLRQIGDAHCALHEHVSAEQYYFDWYLIAEKVGDTSEAARALTLLGQASHARGDLTAAEQWLAKAQWCVRGR